MKNQTFGKKEDGSHGIIHEEELPDYIPEPTTDEKIKKVEKENKELRDRIADATDFNDLKGKLKQIKDSETTPEKWSDKSYYLKGQYLEHKNINYRVLEDHESDKDKEPDVTPEWYERI